jgi:NDP-sugar pyrophosphorylase family protein
LTEIVGVIPAAGYATRLQPLEGSKEVLTIGGKPVMDYLVERMRSGGCTRLRVVTRAEKTDVVAHSRELGAEVVLAEPATVSESFVVGMEGLLEEDIVLIGFPDTLWWPEDGFLVLVRAVQSGCEAALGLFRSHPRDLPRSDVVDLDRSGKVVGVHVKPIDPPSDWVWGCAAARVGSMAGLGGAEWPGGYFGQLVARGSDVRGFPLSGDWLDIGTKDALRLAEVRYAGGAVDPS